MLADTVEAASRTLENPTEERLEKFIQVLINSKIENHQLDDCSLTFSDITKIKESFLQLLVGVYHNRVKYPSQKDPSSEKEEESQASKDNSKEGAEAKETGSSQTEKGKEGALSDKTLTEVKLHG